MDGGNVRQTVGIQVAPGERKDLRVGVDREPTEVAAAAVPKVARKEADVAANIHDRSDGASAFERGSVDVPHDDLIEKEQTFQVAYLKNRTQGEDVAAAAAASAARQRPVAGQSNAPARETSSVCRATRSPT